MSPPAATAAWRRLLAWFAARESALVAFSGGVDSCLVALAAHEALENRSLAVTLATPLVPEGDLRAARELAASLGLRHRVLEVDVLAVPEVRGNAPDRCYHCKRALFSALRELARAEGLAVVVDGTQADDRAEARPGQRALRELGVASPLQELDLGKAAVRSLLRWKGVASAGRPAAACLATRLPFGEALEPERLSRVARAEQALRALGFAELRVRDHGLLARVELPVRSLSRSLRPGLRERVVAALRGAGYVYVSLDLRGLRSGSAEEALVPPAEPGEP